MSLFNEKIKEISIKEALIIIILSYLAAFALKFFNLSAMGIFNVVIILYFVLSLKDFKHEFKLEVSEIFARISFNDILLIVLLNIFFSYGMLYLVGFAISLIPSDTYLRFFIPIKSIIGILSFISIVLVSPIAEELIFRGILLNKLKLIVPTLFAILISSLLFASLHSVGSIFSAFIFAICMAILYLKSENILVPIFAHFLNNLIGESIYHIDYANLLFTNTIVMFVISVLAVVSFILILKFINSNMKYLNNPKIKIM